MEAMASTSGSGFRFHLSDGSLVINFLLPRNLSNEVTESSPIIDDDTYHIEPWNLLAAHEKDVEEGAYFLAKKAKLSSKGLRQKCTVSNADKILGTWRIQHSNTDWALADMTVRWGWSKTLLSYYSADDNSKTTGYVMNECELLENGISGGSDERSSCVRSCHCVRSSSRRCEQCRCSNASYRSPRIPLRLFLLFQYIK